MRFSSMLSAMTTAAPTALEITVRPLLRTEIPALAAAVWDGTSVAQIENRWREQELGYRTILVAAFQARLVGTVSVSESRNEPGSMHLFALDVAPEWRNRGIGARIIRHVCDVARDEGRSRVYLEVRVDNPARRLYHRLGFRRVGPPFVNTWWRFHDDGTRDQVDELSIRMVKRVRVA